MPEAKSRVSFSLIMYMFILKNVLKVSNVGIMPYVFFVPEAKPRDTKHTVGIISI